MKKFFGTILMFVLVLSQGVSAVHAAATVPTATVWGDPATAVAGEAITLNAIVYNGEKQSATVTVAFMADQKDIGTSTTTIPKLSAKTVMVSWVMPKTATTVTVVVRKAVSSSKKELKSLEGPLGTITLGSSTTTSSLIPQGSLQSITNFINNGPIRGWIDAVTKKIEPYRLSALDYFSKLKDQKKIKLGIGVTKPVIVDGYDISGVNNVLVRNTDKTDFGSPIDYTILFFSEACEGYFSNQLFFYVSLVLIVLLIIRAIVGRFK